MNKTALAVRKNNQKIRLAVQIFFFALIALTAVNGYLAERGIVLPLLSTASLHTLCPFGGVVTIYTLLTSGRLIQKIHESALVMLGLTAITAILFGPVFCSWVCPLGSIQEWLGKLGGKLFKKRYNHFLPPLAENVLKWFRFAVLIGVVYMTAKSGVLLFTNIDPYYALFHFWREEIALPALLILGVTLAGSLFVARPWCRFACPLGGLLGLANLFRVFRIRRNQPTCINCNLCSKACPMKIDVAKQSVVRDPACNSCMLCTSDSGACPVADTVNLAR
jgi:polyferredoxin